ncbi:major facilitator superfamily domain-containing protein [Lipomyces doorenjongii]|uniref:major facilitator superfamily domain-containing protein n=1 Tax=Lipomyces doorenjongii TaxID=383834 RepID=UPI0034CE1158
MEQKTAIGVSEAANNKASALVFSSPSVIEPIDKGACGTTDVEKLCRVQSNKNISGPEKGKDEKTVLEPHELYHPDTGRKAWLCVFGAGCGIFCSFGCVFEEYYISHQLKDFTASQVSWITSLEHVWLWTIIMTLGIMMTSVCTDYYQFLLAQGVCTSIGAAMIFNPCISAVSSWFVKKRATALGLVNAGSSLGGVLIPIIFRNVELKAGFGWGVRIVVTSRIRQPGRQAINFKQTYIYPFKSLSFTLSAIGIALVYWGVFIPISFIPSNAVKHGFSPTLAFYRAWSVALPPGVLADKFGRFNIYIIGVYVTAIITVALWIPATGHVPIILYAGLYGFFSGIAVTVWQPMIAEISPIKEIGARLGAVSAIQSFSSLFGSPAGGAIVTHNGGKYWGAAVFAAVTMFAGATVVQCARMTFTNGKLWVAK